MVFYQGPNYIIFKNRQQTYNTKIHIDDCVMDSVTHVKFLGVYIDDKLSWKQHIKYILSKLRSTMYMLYKASKILDMESMKIIYQSLFYPHIEYCCEVWVIRIIVILSVCILKIVLRDNSCFPSVLIFSSLSVLSLYDNILYRTYLLAYKAFSYVLPSKLQIKYIRIYLFTIMCTLFII